MCFKYFWLWFEIPTAGRMADAMLFDQVVFCCISTGLFGYPAAEAADVALTSVQRRTGFAAASFLSGLSCLISFATALCSEKELEKSDEQLLKVQGYHSPNLWKKVRWRRCKGKTYIYSMYLICLQNSI